jgi:hypothetical protein
MAALVGAGLLSGCTGHTAPSLSVAGSRQVEATPDGFVVAFDLEAQNANDVELPLREIRYSLTLDGREVFSGVRSPEATLRRLGTQRFTIPAAVALAPGQAPPAGPTPYVLEGRLAYIAPGQIAQVLFDINVRRPTVRFREEGVVELGAAPR